MPVLYTLTRAAGRLLRGVWKIIEFIAALIYYVLTEIFVDPFIIIKPIKIAAHWIYDNSDHIPLISLYFSYLAHPENKHRAFVWLSQRPWVLAAPPAAVVLMTVVIKFLALKIAVSNPALAVCIFVGDKIVFVPIALRMWDDVRPVVRRDFALRQVDKVVDFVFHQLPRRARYVVRRQTRQLKRYFRPVFAPLLARIRRAVEPLRAVLRPVGTWLRGVLRAWAQAARAMLAAVFWRRKQYADGAPRTGHAKAQRQEGPKPGRKRGKRRGR
jgi:hypothetical protein